MRCLGVIEIRTEAGGISGEFGGETAGTKMSIKKENGTIETLILG